MWGILAAVVVAGVGYAIYHTSSTSGKYDEFAQCLKDKGATFYGAFWCPHCAEQKAMFGKSKDLLPYVECSTPDGRSQTPICTEKGITGYPTWIYQDGEKANGVVQLATLSQKTGCTLPQ